MLMIPVCLSKQVLPDTFKYTLNVLIDQQIDLSIFDYKYSNDETGAPAYDPRNSKNNSNKTIIRLCAFTHRSCDTCPYTEL